MIRVVELFAGVGGFRVGLEKASKDFVTIWANQWEPSTRAQHAFDIYDKHFKKSTNVNKNISDVWMEVPEHDLLVGGFPCQDYSVAQGNRAQGINGKKGVLWWEIYKIIEFRKPKMILLENVDRLLNSPTSNRGRDFAIMLRSLNDLGYLVEWKAITASEYGMAQKRRRVFIYAVLNKKVEAKPNNQLEHFLENSSVLNKTFKNNKLQDWKKIDISKNKYENLFEVTNNYNQGKFHSTGLAVDGIVISANYLPIKPTKVITLGSILDKNEENYIYLNDDQLSKASWTKASKKIERTAKTGFTYSYTEGKMNFPDDISRPGRTMLTSEGTINRSSHFIEHNNKIRFLTPIEAERLNGFPENWTQGKTNRQRYFFMGNALVTDVVKAIGKKIIEELKNEK